MQTPQQGYNPMMTPTPGGLLPGQPGMSVPYWQKDLYDRNKPLTDEELDQLIPSAGYEVSVFCPCSYFLPIPPSQNEQILH
jgi:Splicing factor 3B subunit 1